MKNIYILSIITTIGFLVGVGFMYGSTLHPELPMLKLTGIVLSGGSGLGLYIFGKLL